MSAQGQEQKREQKREQPESVIWLQ